MEVPARHIGATHLLLSLTLLATVSGAQVSTIEKNNEAVVIFDPAPVLLTDDLPGRRDTDMCAARNLLPMFA